jgi:hypothetical protein
MCPHLEQLENHSFEYAQIPNLKGSRPCVVKTYQCLVIQKVLVTPLTRFSRLVKSFVDIQECYMISLWYIIHLRHKKICDQPRAKTDKAHTSDDMHVGRRPKIWIRWQ